MTDKKMEVLSPAEFRKWEIESGAMEQLVEGMLPMRGPNVAIGDSHIGKSPLICQLCVCVASGKPFIGRKTKQGKVLIVDFENAGLLNDMIDETARAVGADPAMVEQNLRILRRDQYQKGKQSMDKLIETGRDYALVAIDSFRYLSGGHENKTDVSMMILEKLGNEKNCWHLVHHIRKGESDRNRQGDDMNLPLIQCTDHVMGWLERASGSRSIINQTTNRWALDNRDIKSDLIVCVVAKGRAEGAPVHLRRIFEGERPIGYEVAGGIVFLTERQQKIFAKVSGKSLTWDELVVDAGGNKSTALRCLDACRQYGLCTTEGRFHTFVEPVEPSHLVPAKPSRFQS